MINVLVVDDSAFMRRIISDIIDSETKMSVCGQAGNGVETLKLIPELKPDIIVLDLEMPIMGGLETLIHIMQKFPLPVIVLSSYESKIPSASIIAIELGAIDFIPKPSGNANLEEIKNILINKIKIASKAKIFNDGEDKISFKGYRKNSDVFAITAIAASTGGVRALSRLIPFISLSYPTPILITQHMPKDFTKNFSQRLNSISKIQVKEAENGERIYNGIAYVAPGDYHLKLERVGGPHLNRYRIKLTQEPKEMGVRPSANKMFESLANLFGSQILALVLTGMGKDGLRGCKEIKKNGGKIVAEDESTCIVYGMPRAVAPIADKILPLSLISDEMLKFIREILKKKGSKKDLKILNISY
ncbi:MAG: protein-glutamate methylesterase/protein-glutamine glutaminase [Promethearchaeota archaeon]